MIWLGVFVRAVIIPAGRRVLPAWIGCAIVGGLLFGKNAMHPHDVTTLALNNHGIGAALAAIWVLIFLPAARVLVRADSATFLRSLPAPRVSPQLLAGAALVVLQLPWLALWIVGDRARGLAIVLAMSLAIAALAAWRPPHHRPRTPTWRSPFAALHAIHVRALARRAGDSILRGIGLAILAGCVAGLFVRNNHLVGADAAVMAASTIAVVVIPAHVGPLVVLVESHRATSWLAQSLGIAPAIRTLALVTATLLVQLAATVIALVAFTIVAGPNVYVMATSLAIATGNALGSTRILLADSHAGARASDTDVVVETSKIAQRAVVAAIVVAAAAIAALTMLGTIGIIGFLAAMVLVLLR